MTKYKHKYIFYFYPKVDTLTNEKKQGVFRFYGRVKDAKETAQCLQREFDYKKIY